MANSRFDQLMQIFRGCVWDGDLISKSDRDSLVNLGLVEKCTGGWNIITAKGITYLVELGFVRSGLTKRVPDALSCEEERCKKPAVMHYCEDHAP